MDGTPLLIDKTIKRIEFLFLYGGINIKSGEKTEKENIKSLIIYIFNFIWFNLDVVGAIYSFVNEIRTGKDFVTVTAIAPCLVMSTLANIKGILLVVNEKHADRLIVNLRNFERRERERQDVDKNNKIINKERDFLNIVITVINWLFVVFIIMYASSPLVMMSEKYYYTKEIDIELILPFLVLYPFDPYKIWLWPLLYLHQIWSACVLSLYICAADDFFFICCTYIRIQFKLLQYDVENLIPIQDNDGSMFLDSDEFKDKFRELVRWHQGLIESTAILEIIYAKSTLTNFVSSSMIICLTGFNVTMVNDLTFHLSFLFLSLFQIFFLCFFADLLMTASMEITDAVYKSRWYMAEPKVRKKLLLMQIRSQQPCKLTAFGFADVNLNSFMRVLSTAWSYFALLQTIYGGDS